MAELSNVHWLLIQQKQTFQSSSQMTERTNNYGMLSVPQLFFIQMRHVWHCVCLLRHTTWYECPQQNVVTPPSFIRTAEPRGRAQQGQFPSTILTFTPQWCFSEAMGKSTCFPKSSFKASSTDGPTYKYYRHH